MQLKRYQKEALKALKAFLEKTRESGDAVKSFEEVTASLDIGRYRNSYRPLKDMEETPYVCIRIPTGGGKTILGAHSVKLAGSSFLERDFPVALWLVPSNTIRKQTVEALKNRRHPYRKVLDDTFDGRVRVFDISEFPNIRPTDMNDSACVIVGTIQALRVSNTEGRKVYSDHEALEPHFVRFTNLPEGLEKTEGGRPKFSLANLLYIHRPLLIVDEAHNAVTGLTREMQGRINPACIIEFTATPKPMSNVLFSVSATVLKEEAMIKLPITLTAHTSWQAAISGALAERTRLEKKAQKEPHYIRPIILFQAENKDREVTAVVLKKHLMENEKIAAEEIAVVTGDQRELDGIDLFDTECPIKYVVTIQALKEGWDCSFAYVFCSVANIRSATAVEQLFGRVLRMPYAERCEEIELNSAYAHICEPDFISAAVDLKDKLVQMGFEAEEAEDNLQFLQPDLGLDEDVLCAIPEVSFELATQPDFSILPEEVRGAIRVEERSGGGAIIRIENIVSEEAAKYIVSLAPKGQQKDIKNRLDFVRHRASRLDAPASKGEPFTVPQLCLFIDGELEVAEPDLFLDFGNWNLVDYEAILPPNAFNVAERSQSYKFDMYREKVAYDYISEDQRQLELSGTDTKWDEKSLVRWLDKQCRDQYVSQLQRLEFVRRIVADQLDRDATIGELVHAKYRLAKAITIRINKCREEAVERGFQRSLFQSDSKVETSFRYTLNLNKYTYQASNYYKGSYNFDKHYFGMDKVGDLKNQGEEFNCAQAIDMQERVKYWVRNLERKPNSSFRLPLAKYWFYPDFVAMLDDGRIFVIEYKGAHLAGNPDTKQKDSVGQLWEERSKGKALFLMAEREKDGLNVVDQIRKKIAG